MRPSCMGYSKSDFIHSNLKIRNKSLILHVKEVTPKRNSEDIKLYLGSNWNPHLIPRAKN